MHSPQLWLMTLKKLSSSAAAKARSGAEAGARKASATSGWWSSAA